MIIAGAISLLVTAGLLLIVFGLVRQRQQVAALDERMATFALRAQSLEELELSRPFAERVMRPMLQRLITIMARYTPKSNMERLQTNLEQAGNPYNWRPIDFVGVRGLTAILLAGLAVVIMIMAKQNLANMIFLPAVLLAVGYILPGIWLGQLIKRRKKNLLKSLPDAIDLLSVSVEAGLGFDQALQRVAVKWENELTFEFQRVLSEMRVGKSRKEALRELAARTGVEDLNTFITAILMADQLGISITQVLRIQAQELRQRRRQRAEVQAHKAPIKMLFPMVFLIFPALWVIILGPAVPQVMETFK